MDLSDAPATPAAAGSAATPLIRIRRVGMVYPADSGPVEALREISLDIGEGEFVALVGPSGCGKSTLMRIIAGLRPVTSGAVEVDGVPVAGPVSRVGMVFQAAVLLKWRSVLDNVLLPAELSGLNPRHYRERALRAAAAGRPGRIRRQAPARAVRRHAAARFALPRADARPADPADGRTVRRARCDDTRGDEPGIAAHLGRGRCCRARRKTIVFVTHSIAEAVFLADRVVVMSPRPGRVAGIHTVPLPRPRTVETRAAPEMGRMTLDIYAELTGTLGTPQRGPQP